MSIDIVVRPKGALVKQLRKQVAAYERRYKVSSLEMAKAVRCGQQKETAEISKWMQIYSVLEHIDRTPTTGTRSKTSSTSTRHG